MSVKPAPTAIPINELIAGRWSPRAFANRPVSTGDLHTILEAARWAPSSYNAQPWRFIVFDRHRDERAFATLAPFNQGWNANVPVLIAVTAQTVNAKGEPNRSAAYDTGAAAMSLVLQAHALDLATHQMGGFDADAFRRAFGVPVSVDILSIVSVGHHGDAGALDAALREREDAPRAASDRRHRLCERMGQAVFDGRLRAT